jgi:YesN/AraC family two-component response regulator
MVEKARQYRPDIIVTDISMPKLNTDISMPKLNGIDAHASFNGSSHS